MAVIFGVTLSPQFQENIHPVLNMFIKNYIMFLTKGYILALKPQLVFNIVTTTCNAKLERCTKCLLWLKEKQLSSKTPVLFIMTVTEIYE